MKPLFALALLCAARAAGAADPAAASRYRETLRECFLHAAPVPPPPPGAELGDPRDPSSAAWLARAVGELQAGTAADPLAAIHAAAEALSPTAPLMPGDGVVSDYLRRKKGVGTPGASSPRRGEVAVPESARTAQLHAQRLAALLQASRGSVELPASSSVLESAGGSSTRGGAVGPTGGRLTAVSDLRTTGPPAPAPDRPRPSASLLSRLGTWTYETGKGYATGALNLVNDGANLTNMGANALLSLTPVRFRFRTDLHIAPSTDSERYAQNAVEVASVVTGGVGLVRSAPELAVLSGRISERAGALFGRVARRTGPEPAPAAALETHPVVVAHAGDRTFMGRSYEDISLMKAFNPDEFELEAQIHPELRIIADDEKFRPLDGLTRAEADRLIERMYPGRYMDGLSDWNAYENRKIWRREAGGRPIPGDPGGPPKSEVDRMMGSPHLPPRDAPAVTVQAPGGVRASLYNEFSGDESYRMGTVNAYGPDLKRIGALPYTVQKDGRVLSIGHMYMDASARSRIVDGARAPGLGTPMIAEMVRANPHAVAVKAVLTEDNGAAFHAAFARGQDYFEGIRNTPLYKALARQGFTKIEPPSADWRESPFIPFQVSK